MITMLVRRVRGFRTTVDAEPGVVLELDGVDTVVVDDYEVD